MNCDWVEIAKGRWRCPACKRERDWSRPGPPPLRRCTEGQATPAPPIAAAKGRQPAVSLDCLHRGEMVRTEQCESCQGKIDLPVYQCVLYGECTKENLVARNPKLAGIKVCRGCPEQKQSEPGVPGLAAKVKHYTVAQLRDRANGRVRRSPELVSKLFHQHCKLCPRYNAERGACADCGCPVHPTETEANKLAWQSETCPQGKWPITRANLIYYVLPLKHGDDVWQWNVRELRKRLPIFNGRRIVAIGARGPNGRLALDAPEEVIAAFGDDAASIEFVEIENSPLRETPAFRAMLRMIATGETTTNNTNDTNEKNQESYSCDSRDSWLTNVVGSPSEATFFGHAKGVTRALQAAIRPWTEAMYHHNLDRWEELREILSVYPCAGMARQYTWPQKLADDRPGGWVFAGTFFWFNHQALFSRPRWWDIPDHSHQVEGYLGHQFGQRDGYCLAYDGVTNVYEAGTWAGWKEKSTRLTAGPAGHAPAIEFVAGAREIKTLNLIYHLWPVASSDLWRWNLRQVMDRIDLFNGKRVIAVALDDHTVSIDEVQRELTSSGLLPSAFCLLPLENNPRLREAASIVRLLEAVKTSDRTHATFYAHAKGVSRTATIEPVSRAWAEAMYRGCLDDPAKVRAALAAKAMFGVSFRGETRWRYPGTFWWFHNASLFDREGWNTLANPISQEGLGWAVEALPNRFFTDGECAREWVELKDVNSDMGLYDPRVWEIDDRSPPARDRAMFRWRHHVEREGMTWGVLMDGANIVKAVARHATLAGASVAEIGPGYGRFLASLGGAGIASYAALEISTQRARSLCAEFPHATIVAGDVEHWPDLAALGTADIVVSTLCFNRQYPDFSRAAANCCRLLSPGGKLIFDVGEMGDPDYRDTPAAGFFEPGTRETCFDRAYSRPQIETLLRAAGYGDVEFDEIRHGDHRRLLVIATKLRKWWQLIF